MLLEIENQLVFFDFSLIMSFIIAFFVIFLIIAVIAYILSAIIYSTTAKTNGFHEIAWISWIPIINIYILFALGSKKAFIPEIKSECVEIYIILFWFSHSFSHTFTWIPNSDRHGCVDGLLFLPIILPLD
ncbi:hypothetical protein UACE39S_04200 [Ureibacillus acetophenoni]